MTKTKAECDCCGYETKLTSYQSPTWINPDREDSRSHNICEVCANQLSPGKSENRNLAVATNMILDAIRQSSNLTTGDEDR